MRIYWYDRAYIHQSFALPYLPLPEETMMAYSPGVKHTAPNVLGSESFRVPISHCLVDDGHEIVWGSHRDIMPSRDIDFDLARLCDEYPELQEFVRDEDPMLDVELWDPHKPLEKAYLERFTPGEKKAKTGKRGVQPGDEDYTLGWLKDNIEAATWGQPPEVDIGVIAIVRGNVISGFEQTYDTAQLVRQGVPVIWYDQDRQLAASVNAWTKTGHEWPHPLITVIGPYSEPYGWSDEHHLIDYPYIRPFADYWDKHGVPVGARTDGTVYVGNDYGRRKLMEEYLLPLTEIDLPVTVWGKFDNKDSDTGEPADVFKARWPEVNWAGRIETNRMLQKYNRGILTVNLFKKNYQKIGQITMRTNEAAQAGCLQLMVRENVRATQFFDEDFIVGSKSEALAKAHMIAHMAHREKSEYEEALETQRNKIADQLDLHTYYMPRLYELMELARSKAGAIA